MLFFIQYQLLYVQRNMYETNSLCGEKYSNFPRGFSLMRRTKAMKSIAAASEALKSYYSTKFIAIIWLAYAVFLIWAYHFSISCFSAKETICMNAEDSMEVFNVISFLSIAPFGTLLSIVSLLLNREGKNPIKLSKNL